MALIQLHERCHCGVAKAAVCRLKQAAQLGLTQCVADERRADPHCGLDIVQPSKAGDRGRVEPGNVLRHIQAAIACQPSQCDRFEVEERRAAAGAQVTHRRRCLAIPDPRGNLRERRRA